MGVLDDAIRDHLDLKRRRGADPAEVERAEREALGPVRRTPEEPGGIEFAPEPGHEDDYLESEPLADAGDDADWQDPFAEEPDPDATAVYQLPPDPETFAEPEPAAPRASAAPAPEPVAPAPEPANREPRQSPLGDLFEPSDPVDDEPREPVRRLVTEPPVTASRLSGPGDETVEYDVDEALEAEPASGDDVLEETPEFLQDTPDHDRLWFEQKPPKDFDFDG
jgi:hypothetical protein